VGGGGDVAGGEVGGGTVDVAGGAVSGGAVDTGGVVSGRVDGGSAAVVGGGSGAGSGALRSAITSRPRSAGACSSVTSRVTIDTPAALMSVAATVVAPQEASRNSRGRSTDRWWLTRLPGCAKASLRSGREQGGLRR
jgi:hypothetical protein